MSGTIPNIAMGFRPTPNVGPDFGQSLAQAQQTMQLQQQARQVQQQNALMSIFKDPTSLDATGQPTPETLQKVTSINPEFGLKLRQNMMIDQVNDLRRQGMKSDLAASNAERINSALAPAHEHYLENLKKGMPEPQARQIAQEEMKAGIDGLEKGGFDPALLKMAPQTYDPKIVGPLVEQTGNWKNYVTETHADKRLHDQEEATNARATELLTTPGGKVIEYHKTEKDPAKRFTYSDGTPASQDDINSASGKADAGKPAGSTAAAKTQEEYEALARQDFITKYGHPPDLSDPKQKSDLAQFVLDRKNKDAGDKAAAKPLSPAQTNLKADRDNATVAWKKSHDGKAPDMDNEEEAAAFEKSVQDITTNRLADAAKVKKDTVNPTSKEADADTIAKHDVALQNKEPISEQQERDYQLANARQLARRVPAAPGSSQAERVARFAEMKAAQQKAGVYKDDTSIYRAMDRQITEDKQTAISDEAADIAADVALKTGHPPAWMGRSQASLTKFLDAYARRAKEQHLGPNEIASNQAKFAGEMAEARTLGTMSARIDFAAKELDVALPEAQDASQRVWRPGFKKVAELQQAIKGQTSDPDLLEFAQWNQQVMSAYAAAMNRGGVSTVHAMERAESLLSTATSQTGYMRQLDTLHKEVQTILYGTQSAKDHLRAEITNSPEITTPPTLTGVPRPAAVAIPTSLQDADKAGKLAHNADGSAFYNTETKKYYDKDGKETGAPGASSKPEPAKTEPAQQSAHPPVPAGLPDGSQWSPSRKQWRDPSGKLFDADGKPVGG